MTNPILSNGKDLIDRVFNEYYGDNVPSTGLDNHNIYVERETTFETIQVKDNDGQIRNINIETTSTIGRIEDNRPLPPDNKEPAGKAIQCGGPIRDDADRFRNSHHSIKMDQNHRKDGIDKVANQALRPLIHPQLNQMSPDTLCQHLFEAGVFNDYIKEVAAQYGVSPQRVYVKVTFDPSVDPFKDAITTDMLRLKMAEENGVSIDRVQIIRTEIPPEPPTEVQTMADCYLQEMQDQNNRLAVLGNCVKLPVHSSNENNIGIALNELDIMNPTIHLEKSVGDFQNGDYTAAINHFQNYASLAPISSEFKIKENVQGFSKELLHGIGDSAKVLFFFASDLITHPIHTGTQVCQAFKELSKLALAHDWEAMGEALVPEALTLVKEWGNLSVNKRAEQAGYIFGKYGADLLVPGAIFKGIGKGIKTAKELNAVSKALKVAENTLVLESTATLESGAQVAKVIQANQKIVTAGNELGMSAREMFKLKQAGNLKDGLNSVYENMFKTPVLRESFEKFLKAEEMLKPYANKIMPEGQIKELIHQAGVETFPRPTGVPDNYIARITDKGAGIEYVHPTNIHITVRVMPGKPHSSFEYQHNPYVIQKIEGKIIDELGSVVDKKAPEAHIPLNNFIFKGL